MARQAIAEVERADQAFFRPAGPAGDGHDGAGLDSDQIASLLRRLAEAP